MEQKEVSFRKGELLLWFCILALPYFLNDFASIFIRDWKVWLAIDYAGLKLSTFVIIGIMIMRKMVRPEEIGLSMPRVLPFVIVVVVFAWVGTFLDQNCTRLFQKLFGSGHLGGMPVIDSKFWNWTDLIFGLLLVGVCEELVFRGVFHRVLTGYTRNPVLIVLISSVLFGLIHWSNGIANVLNATVIGAVFMVVYLRTRSLYALMIAHFFVDFAGYSGVIPLSWFGILRF